MPENVKGSVKLLTYKAAVPSSLSQKPVLTSHELILGLKSFFVQD
jgi:hypothetical protein